MKQLGTLIKLTMSVFYMALYPGALRFFLSEGFYSGMGEWSYLEF